MDKIKFTNFKADFIKADTSKKIEMYINAEGLSSEQYKDLLRLYPIQELNMLEEALTKV